MKKTIRIAAASFLFGAVCLSLAQFLPVFAPCRVLYRVHDPVQDSVTCRIFSALGLVGLALLLIGVIFFLYTVCLIFLSHRKSPE